jgi:putative PEP-CTERM system integral membrane protein
VFCRVLSLQQLVLYRSRQENLSELKTLDAIHAIAKQAQIVTPYSSMLVLVNDAQREALKQAEAADDRFEREVETGDEDLTQPGDPVNVPETSTLLGIAVASWVLLAFLRHRARTRLWSAR